MAEIHSLNLQVDHELSPSHVNYFVIFADKFLFLLNFSSVVLANIDFPLEVVIVELGYGN